MITLYTLSSILLVIIIAFTIVASFAYKGRNTLGSDAMTTLFILGIILLVAAWIISGKLIGVAAILDDQERKDREASIQSR